ncbi:cAMP-specific phosphodiesterase [Trichophyton tonsurans CBS 112818]|uniref:cAMP-specific phosphodiesterase n=1 Tax=Trichophyton tonsurans (strain CBS 112818) TaxID=647933 RepID=F2S191_TRIT1|nr:cAMP-specific phosphodiesterase [Trichophyton tonsurans CBS 112818]
MPRARARRPSSSGSGPGSGRMITNGSADGHVFHVVVLGASGGPREDTATGMLVRSTATDWARGSVVAVDAGTLLSAIIRILETDSPSELDTDSSHARTHLHGQRRVVSSGPFAGLELPFVSAEANAAYIFRDILAAVLITHPHLDHVSGLAMNTPAVEAQSGPKTVAALPSTIAALKNHLFNDITWPNLSDEDGGAGLITYQRLVDGGNQRLGRGPAKGYVRACDGLMIKCLGVSHGRCRQRYNPETEKHHRAESTVFMTDPVLFPSRRVSIDASSLRSYSPSTQAQQLSLSTNGKDSSTYATVESSAFFIRDDLTGAEIIIFGDIEPDSISLEPRNERVWEAAAPKINDGCLRAIFIECSYTDAVEDNSLYGHLCPRHLIAELEVLAGKVLDSQKPHKGDSRKRKRASSFTGLPAPAAPAAAEQSNAPLSPKSKENKSPFAAPSAPKTRSATIADSATSRHNTRQSAERVEFSTAYAPQPQGKKHSHSTSSAAGVPDPMAMDTTTDSPTTTGPQTRYRTSIGGTTRPLPLQDLTVYIIHVKDTLTDDGPPRDQILAELRQLGEEAGLGCEFHAPLSGKGVFI